MHSKTFYFPLPITLKPPSLTSLASLSHGKDSRNVSVFYVVSLYQGRFGRQRNLPDFDDQQRYQPRLCMIRNHLHRKMLRDLLRTISVVFS
jgi:hypothetical protein